MKKEEILSKVDHTLLKQTATWEQIRVICDEGAEYQTASVCIPPCFVKQAKEYVQGKVAICTVIGCDLGTVLLNSASESKDYQSEKVVQLFHACSPEVKPIALELLKGLSKL